MKPKKNTLEKLRPLLKKPVFNASEAREQHISSALIAYYVKTGHLVRVRRGVYRAADFNEPESLRWDDLIQAVCSTPGAIVCLVSALAIYDLTEVIPREHWLAVSHNTSIKKRRLIKIVRFRNLELGKMKIDLDGISIPIYDRERTIVDSFRLLDREIAIKALKAAFQKPKKEKLDLVKLQKYAQELSFDIEPYLLTVTT